MTKIASIKDDKTGILSSRKYRKEDKTMKNKTLVETKENAKMTQKERLKYEIAEELGLLDRIQKFGWKSLSAKETGKIGGLMTKRKKEIQHKEKKTSNH